MSEQKSSPVAYHAGSPIEKAVWDPWSDATTQNARYVAKYWPAAPVALTTTSTRRSKGISNKQAGYLAALQRKAGEKYTGRGMSRRVAREEIFRLLREAAAR
jgi:hypothetical protein